MVIFLFLFSNSSKVKYLGLNTKKKQKIGKKWAKLLILMKLICNKIKIYGKFYKLLTKFKTLVETDLCPRLHSVAKICQQIISEEILGKKVSSKLLEKRKGKKMF